MAPPVHRADTKRTPITEALFMQVVSPYQTSTYVVTERRSSQILEI